MNINKHYNAKIFRVKSQFNLIVITLVVQLCSHHVFASKEASIETKEELYNFVDSIKINRIINEINLISKSNLKTIDIVISDTSRIKQIVKKDLSYIFKQNPQAGEMIYGKGLISKKVPLLSSAIIAKYNHWDKKIYFQKEKLLSIQKEYNFNTDEMSQLFQLLIIHETFHLVQDNKLNIIDTLAKIKNQEEYHIFMSIIEGHAQVIMKEIGKKLELDSNIQELIGKVVYKPDNKNLPKHVISAREESMNFAYKHGENYLRHKYQTISNKIWNEYKDLPKSTYNLLNFEFDFIPPRQDFILIDELIKSVYIDCSIVKNELNYFYLYLAYIGYESKYKQGILKSAIRATSHRVICENKNHARITIIALNKNTNNNLGVNFLEITKENLLQIPQNTTSIQNHTEHMLNKYNGHIIQFDILDNNKLRHQNLILRLFFDDYIIEWSDFHGKDYSEIIIENIDNNLKLLKGQQVKLLK